MSGNDSARSVESSFHTVWGVWTPAKLNLFLEILGRRADGYHEIETVMTAVGVYDSLTFAVREAPQLRIATRWSYGMANPSSGGAPTGATSVGDLPEQKNNIVTRALSLFATTSRSAIWSKGKHHQTYSVGSRFGGSPRATRRPPYWLRIVRGMSTCRRENSCGWRPTWAVMFLSS